MAGSVQCPPTEFIQYYYYFFFVYYLCVQKQIISISIIFKFFKNVLYQLILMTHNTKRNCTKNFYFLQWTAILIYNAYFFGTCHSKSYLSHAELSFIVNTRKKNDFTNIFLFGRCLYDSLLKCLKHAHVTHPIFSLQMNYSGKQNSFQI